MPSTGRRRELPTAQAYLRAIHHVNLAHGAAVDVLRALVPGASIGAIHNRQPVLPEHGNAPENQAAAELLDEHWNRAFPDPQILGYYPPQIARGDRALSCRPATWRASAGRSTGSASIITDRSSPRPIPNTTWGFAWGDVAGRCADLGDRLADLPRGFPRRAGAS